MNLAENYERIIVPAIMDGWAKDLAKVATTGNHVLDVACGTGVVSRYAATEVGESGKVTGLDLNPDMLAVARSVPVRTALAIEWHEAAATQIPFVDEVFDVVLCQFGLMFMPDQLAALTEMRRVLKPGGKLGLNVWCSGPYDQIFEGTLAKYVGEEAAHSPIWAFGNPAWLRSLVEKAEFEINSLKTNTKPTRYQSIRQSVEVIVDWNPALQSMSNNELDKFIADLEIELNKYIVSDHIVEWPESANVVIASVQ